MLVPFLGGGRSSGEGSGNPFQYSFLENSMDRGSWCAIVHGVSKSRTRLKWLSMHACTLPLLPDSTSVLNVLQTALQGLILPKMRYPETNKGLWLPCTRLRSLEHKSHWFQWASSCPHLPSHRSRPQSTELLAVTPQHPASHLFHTRQCICANAAFPVKLHSTVSD